MKYLTLTLLLTIAFGTYSQDGFVNSTCGCLDNLMKLKLDKVDFQLAHDACFKEAYSKITSISPQDSSDAFYLKFIEGMKTNCDSYNKSHNILDKMTLEKSKIRVKDKRLCKQTMLTGEFEDMAGPGTEKVIISMRDSIQIVTFGEKRLYTKSTIRWLDECAYKVMYVESTNPFEVAVLKSGDERVIRIIDIKSNGEILFETGMYDRWFVGRVKKIK